MPVRRPYCRRALATLSPDVAYNFITQFVLLRDTTGSHLVPITPLSAGYSSMAKQELWSKEGCRIWTELGASGPLLTPWGRPCQIGFSRDTGGTRQTEAPLAMEQRRLPGKGRPEYISQYLFCRHALVRGAWGTIEGTEETVSHVVVAAASATQAMTM
jgi:hypothetical protein